MTKPKRIGRRRLPVTRFPQLAPEVNTVGGRKPYIWIGSEERGALCVIDRPAQLRRWIATMQDMLAVYESEVGR